MCKYNFTDVVFYPYTLLDLLSKILQYRAYYKYGVSFGAPLPDLMLITANKM
ncbi:hypothetical protein IFVP177_C1320194 [Vibrio parahaemolyticus]